MAKTKKQEKSIEQRLEEALVLYEKTPYKLPSNWCWTRLGTVCKLDNGEKINNEELFYLDAKTLRTQSYEQTRKDGVVVEEGQKIIPTKQHAKKTNAQIVHYDGSLRCSKAKSAFWLSMENKLFRSTICVEVSTVGATFLPCPVRSLYALSTPRYPMA